MGVIGMLMTGFLAISGVAIAALAVGSAGEIARYFRMRSM